MSKKEYLDRHGKPIDIYNYPEAATPQELSDYRHAVEVAHERDGLPVEGGVSGCRDGWCPVASPMWAWGAYAYRIAAPKIAKGHNPDKLTEEQVGVNDGWRLLEPEEIAKRPMMPSIMAWYGEGWGNGLGLGHSGDTKSITYRTKQPPGYFLPKKQEADEEAALRIWRELYVEDRQGNLAVLFARKLLEWERSKRT